ncbi:MAG TPA: preprotein translocase subunit SecE [Pseudonocardiaceae bacterium]|nr:preprotein translocase subunit SecE [Pseudonocardiaceae bacterium]
MSEDRAHEMEDRLGEADAPHAAAAVRRNRLTQVQPTAGKGHPTKARNATGAKAAAPAQLMRFLREVVAELTKVIWPSRRELVVYTSVVLVFVSFMVAFVALLDMGLGRLVLSVFG